jgi:hypothetical protein
MQAYHQGYPAEPNNEGQGFSGGAGRLRRSLTARRHCSSGVSRWRRRARHASAITVAVASATIHSTAVTIMCQMMARLRPSRKWSAHPSRVSLHESHLRSPVAVDANVTRVARCPRVGGRLHAAAPFDNAMHTGSPAMVPAVGRTQAVSGRRRDLLGGDATRLPYRASLVLEAARWAGVPPSSAGETGGCLLCGLYPASFCALYLVSS